MEDKVRENRLRRAAKRQDFLLVRSRRRDERSTAYGLYAVIATPTPGGRLTRVGRMTSTHGRSMKLSNI